MKIWVASARGVRPDEGGACASVTAPAPGGVKKLALSTEDDTGVTFPTGPWGVAAGLSIAIAALAACAFAALGYLCVLHKRYKETTEVSV